MPNEHENAVVYFNNNFYQITDGLQGGPYGLTELGRGTEVDAQASDIELVLHPNQEIKTSNDSFSIGSIGTQQIDAKGIGWIELHLYHLHSDYFFNLKFGYCIKNNKVKVFWPPETLESEVIDVIENIFKIEVKKVVPVKRYTKGFYWVRFHDPMGQSNPKPDKKLTVGYYKGPRFFSDGSGENNYPWQVIGSDNGFSDKPEDWKHWLIIGPKISTSSLNQESLALLEIFLIKSEKK